MNGGPARPGWVYRLSWCALEPATRLLRGIEAEGEENIPLAGRVILAVNHRSWLDPPLVSLVAYRRRFPRFLGKAELFAVPGLGWFLRQIGVIPLDRSRGDIGAIRQAMAVLEAGGCMILFPEGTRSKTGEPGRPKAGVGLLARESGAPVVPARVRNTERLLSTEPLRIRFGAPLRYEGGSDRRACQEFAERVMEEIWRL